MTPGFTPETLGSAVVSAIEKEAKAMNLGLLILRLIVGFLFVGHGAQKLFGIWGGHGLAQPAPGASPCRRSWRRPARNSTAATGACT